MIEQILRRPVSVAVATLAMCALGVFSLLELPLSLLPSIERPKLVIEARAETLHERQQGTAGDEDADRVVFEQPVNVGGALAVVPLQAR